MGKKNKKRHRHTRVAESPAAALGGVSARSKKVSLCAVFAALVFCATFLVKIPLPGLGGYIHAGDGVIMLAGAFLGPAAALPAAIGSTLADLFGYAQYALPTLIIKGLLGLTAGLSFKHISGTWVKAAAATFAELIIVGGGYLLTESFMYGFYAALYNSIMGLPQLAFGAVAGVCAGAYRRKITDNRTQEDTT